jgi:uncharacterized membrane protein SirB2
MMLAEFYPQIKTAHVALVSASGLLFALRGAAVLAGHSWPLRRTLRLSSVAIDSALLAAGLLLWSLLALQPLRDPWLSQAASAAALHRVRLVGAQGAQTQRGRALAYTAALACYLYMISVALAHHPLARRACSAKAH